MNPGMTYLHYVSAGRQHGTSLIPVDDVIFFRAGGAYTDVVTRAGKHRIHTPLSELQPMLDPRKFRQVQRATIVNIGRISSIERKAEDQIVLKLKECDECITVCYPYCQQFREQ